MYLWNVEPNKKFFQMVNVKIAQITLQSSVVNFNAKDVNAFQENSLVKKVFAKPAQITSFLTDNKDHVLKLIAVLITSES